MANQKHIAGLDRLEIQGTVFSWNPTFSSYWTVNGDPRALQESELVNWRMTFQSGRSYGPDGHRIELRIIFSQLCPLEERVIYRVMFLDHTRGICGYLHLANLTPESFMRVYDAGRYEGSWTGSFADDITTLLSRDYAAALEMVAKANPRPGFNLPTFEELKTAITTTIDDEALSFPTFKDFYNWWDVVSAYDGSEPDEIPAVYRPLLELAYRSLVLEGAISR